MVRAADVNFTLAEPSPARAESADNLRVSQLVELISSLGHSGDPHEGLEGLASGVLRSGRAAYAEIITSATNPRHYTIERLRTDDGQDMLRGVAQVEAARESSFFASLIKSPQPRLLPQIDLAGDPVLPAEMQVYRSALAVPIFSDQSVGRWVVLLGREPGQFGVAELEELIVRTSLVSAMSANLQTARQLFDANLKVQREISEIADIQRALLPDQVPNIPGLRIAASYESMTDAGGDMYDFVPLGKRPGYLQRDDDLRWAILIGDVSGHGIAAAVVMAMLHSILHAFPQSPTGPAELLTHVNNHLCAKRIGRSFATVFLAFYDPPTRRLTYARAGQTPPLFMSPNQERPQYLDTVGDLPLGVFPESTFAESTIELRSGDTI
ncbi:MAG TPA: SpoIIE family protein phosphatase, partial [Tepidisphaeraceae bacterium]|nr:SpoIIE family protein phosphatase [Tepidisphaeraceae bacterium]